MKTSIIVTCVLVLAIAIIFLVTRRNRWPVGKVCAVCGAGAQYGYSEHAESDPGTMKPLCRKCLIAQLTRDYAAYTRRAVVIQPVVGPPCYVFQPNGEWGKFFKDSKIDDDVREYISKMDKKCHECGSEAHFLWVGARGLTADNFGETLDKGFSQTLLGNNPETVSLCGKCCARRIAEDLKAQNISYLEVCGPKGDDDGFVIPMGY